MKTDVDTALKEIADWFIENRRGITNAEIQPILRKHCEDEAEVHKFVKFLETGPGQLRFKTLLRERFAAKPEITEALEILERKVKTPEEMRRLMELGGKISKPEHKFPMGQIVMTRGVNDLIAESVEFSKFVSESLGRHSRGDWGDLSEEDKKQNEYALDKYLRLFSAYEKPPLRKIWIITEADRSVTTTLFPSEY